MQRSMERQLPQSASLCSKAQAAHEWMSPLYCWAMLRGEAKQVGMWSPMQYHMCVLFCMLPSCGCPVLCRAQRALKESSGILSGLAFLLQLVPACLLLNNAAAALCSAGPSRALEESFVMLAGTASLLQQAPAGVRASPSPAIPLQALDDKFRQMAAIFELASRATLVREIHI